MFRKRLANLFLHLGLCRKGSGFVRVVRKIEASILPYFCLCFPREKTTTAFSVFYGEATTSNRFRALIYCRIRLRRIGPAIPSAANGQGSCSCRHKSRTSVLVGGAHPR